MKKASVSAPKHYQDADSIFDFAYGSCPKE
jgi:hypothetical protein